MDRRALHLEKWRHRVDSRAEIGGLSDHPFRGSCLFLNLARKVDGWANLKLASFSQAFECRSFQRLPAVMRGLPRKFGAPGLWSSNESEEKG